MNAKSNSIQILAEGNPDTITRLPPHVLYAAAWENPAGHEWAEIFPLIRRAEEDEGEKGIMAASGRAFMAASIALPSADAGETWEALASLPGTLA